jgi:SAM-dependent methyltransferase
VADFLLSYYRGKVDPSSFGDVRFQIEYCAPCNFYWQRWILDSDGMDKLYGEWIDPEESQIKAQRITSSQYLTIAKILARQFATITSDRHRYLDLGAGWSTWALVAQAMGQEAYIVENSEARRAAAEKIGIRAVEDLSTFSDDHFSLVSMNQVLEHIPEPLDIVKEVYRVLAPGGGCAISVPYARPAVSVVARGPFHPLEHVNGFSPKALRRIVKNAGLMPARDPDILALLTPHDLLRSLSRSAIMRIAPKAVLPFRTSIFCIKR